MSDMSNSTSHARPDAEVGGGPTDGVSSKGGGQLSVEEMGARDAMLKAAISISTQSGPEDLRTGAAMLAHAISTGSQLSSEAMSARDGLLVEAFEAGRQFSKEAATLTGSRSETGHAQLPEDEEAGRILATFDGRLASAERRIDRVLARLGSS